MATTAPTTAPTATTVARGYQDYPTNSTLIWLYRAPLMLWRLGLGRLVGPGLLLLTTSGRRSGQPRRTVLEYRRLDERIYVYSGYGPTADWWRNIAADPHVTVQVGAMTATMLARRITDPRELASLLRRYMLAYPAVARLYLDATGIKTFPDDVLAHPERFYLLTFEPTAEAAPPAQPADLAWVWPVVVAMKLVALGAIWRYARRRD